MVRSYHWRQCIPSGSNLEVPGTVPLFANGVGVLGLLGWRRKRKNGDDRVSGQSNMASNCVGDVVDVAQLTLRGLVHEPVA